MRKTITVGSIVVFFIFTIIWIASNSAEKNAESFDYVSTDIIDKSSINERIFEVKKDLDTLGLSDKEKTLQTWSLMKANPELFVGMYGDINSAIPCYVYRELIEYSSDVTNPSLNRVDAINTLARAIDTCPAHILDDFLQSAGLFANNGLFSTPNHEGVLFAYINLYKAIFGQDAFSEIAPNLIALDSHKNFVIDIYDRWVKFGNVESVLEHVNQNDNAEIVRQVEDAIYENANWENVNPDAAYPFLEKYKPAVQIKETLFSKSIKYSPDDIYSWIEKMGSVDRENHQVIADVMGNYEATPGVIRDIVIAMSEHLDIDYLDQNTNYLQSIYEMHQNARNEENCELYKLALIRAARGSDSIAAKYPVIDCG